MLEFADEQEDRHTLAELPRAYQDAPLIQKLPFIEKDGHACHTLGHLAADVRNNRKVDFRAAGWRW